MSQSIIMAIKSSTTFTVLVVFIASGLYLLIIDGADLKNKNLKRELKFARIIGFLYIFGSVIAYIFVKHVL
ncbi:MAG: CLC_0170 family protein [Tepidanaerobacteraceae bacterium]|jgi:HKD family nuclease